MTSTKKMTKTEIQVMEYVAYAKSVNVHVKPTKTISSGLHGHAFERVLKFSAFGNKHFKGTSPAGRVDTRKKINGSYMSFEIKQGCGELGILDKNGKITKSCFNTKYMIYCPDFDINRDFIKQAYIIDTSVFLNLLGEIGLIRKKMSSAMYNRPVELRYHDRITIQTFLNSEKKTNLFYDRLEELGESFENWIKENLEK
jgi:hypothetical protein